MCRIIAYRPSPRFGKRFSKGLGHKRSRQWRRRSGQKRGSIKLIARAGRRRKSVQYWTRSRQLLSGLARGPENSTPARRRAVTVSRSLICAGTRRSSSSAKVRQIIGKHVRVTVRCKAKLRHPSNQFGCRTRRPGSPYRPVDAVPQSHFAPPGGAIGHAGRGARSYLSAREPKTSFHSPKWEPRDAVRPAQVGGRQTAAQTMRGAVLPGYPYARGRVPVRDAAQARRSHLHDLPSEHHALYGSPRPRLAIATQVASSVGRSPNFRIRYQYVDVSHEA